MQAQFFLDSKRACEIKIKNGPKPNIEKRENCSFNYKFLSLSALIDKN